MMGGKLGEIAKEIAEETAHNMNFDMNGATDINGVLSCLLKNPAKLMNMVKDIGGKLDEKMKSGDLNEGELFTEASDIMKKMKNIPGMGNIQDMMSKMGMGPSQKKNVSKANNSNHSNHSNHSNNSNHSNHSNNFNNRFNSRETFQPQTQTQREQEYSHIPSLTDDQLISIFSENNSIVKKEEKKDKNEKKEKKEKNNKKEKNKKSNKK
jgi:spore coat protein CotH